MSEDIEKACKKSAEVIKDAKSSKKEAAELGVRVPSSLDSTVNKVTAAVNNTKKIQVEAKKATTGIEKNYDLLKNALSKHDEEAVDELLNKGVELTDALKEKGYVSFLVSKMNKGFQTTKNETGKLEKKIDEAEKKIDEAEKKTDKTEKVIPFDTWQFNTYYIRSQEDIKDKKKVYGHVLPIQRVIVEDSSIKSIPAGFFKDISELSIIDLNNVEVIEDEAFAGCKNLVSIDLGKVKKIGKRAFANCEKLEEVFAENAKIICENAFESCKLLERVKIQNVETIKECAFSNCFKLENVVAVSVKNIGPYAFNDCISLKIFKAQNIATIGEYAFSGCIKLKNMSTASVKNIGTSAFKNCKSLEEIQFLICLYMIVDRKVLEGCSSLRKIEAINVPNKDSFKKLSKQTGKEPVIVKLRMDGIRMSGEIVKPIGPNQIEVALRAAVIS